MKKLIILLFLLVISYKNFAQKVSFGLKGGKNFSTQNFDPNYTVSSSIKNNYLAGFHIGAIGNIGYKNFTIQPGLFYTTKGLGYPEQDIYLSPFFSNHITKNTQRFNYVELQTNLLYNLFDIGAFALKLGGGPYIAKGTAITISTIYNTWHVDFDQTKSPMDSYNSLDYGVTFLGEIEISKIILMSAQYGLGLNNISKNTVIPSDHISNRVFSISLGFLIR